MSSISNFIGVGARPTALSMSNALLAALQNTQQAMATTQNEISTGKAVNVPGDAPDEVASILALQEKLAQQTQTATNQTNASSVLDSADQALSTVGTALNSTSSLALSQIGVGSTAATRSSEATVVNSTLQSLLSTANSRFQNISLFGGATNPPQGQNVFSSFLGGVLYSGSTKNLTADVGLDSPVEINSNGAEAFGAVSAPIEGNDLDPQATAATQLSDVGGAQGQGVRLGSVVVSVDNSSVTVDLSQDQTLGDVATSINNAITSLNSGAGSLAVGGQGFALNAAAGHTVQITDANGGEAAADLGIAVTAAGGTGGASTAGAAINPQLTLETPVSALGAGIDLTSGLKITQGGQTAVADFSSAKTIGDMINEVKGLNLGVSLQINSSGTGLNLVDQVSGISLSVGENGGHTAADLGLSTMGANTTLASLNQGQGLSRVQGQPDFQVQLHNGTTFSVDLDGATTVGDVINDIQSAATAAGLTSGTTGATGTQFNVGLATTGAGLVLQDNTTGSGDFKVSDLGQSQAADGLGIVQDAGTGTTIQGADVGAVQVNGVFTHLIQLSNALTNNNNAGISLAATAIQSDASNVTLAQGGIGAREQQVTNAQSATSEMQLTQQTLLSSLQSTNMTSAITQFTQLQQQMEGALQVGASVLSTSLLNFMH